ncbi:MAG TPA: pectin acetylesterase-family hydrolase [Polyangiaceae bacterium]|nr:pectin acetylesterase-family hydrolase [Polyangiaceae bacterium]
MMKRRLSFLGILATTSLLGCSSSDKASTQNPSSGQDGGGGGGNTGEPGFNAAAAAELHDKGVDKYLNTISLNDSTTTGTETVFNFDATEGPVCFLGDPFHVIAHDAGSENLLIYLQGGGACWTDLCAATSTAGTEIPKTGLLDEDPSKNPVGDWNIVYAPYCDGSVFSGDNDITGPNGENWKFHGLANVSATVAVAKKLFPDAKRILLAGSSAGGYGTLSGTGVVRLAFPHVKLDVFNDAGLGLSNPDNATMLPNIKRDWKFMQFVPDSCTDCQTGMLTSIIAWGLKNDPSLHASGFSSYNDSVIGGVFLGMQPDAFKQLLVSETGKIHDAYPDRMERFFINGSQHTILLGGAPGYYDAVDGVSVADFLKGQLEGNADVWKDHLQQ